MKKKNALTILAILLLTIGSLSSCLANEKEQLDFYKCKLMKVQDNGKILVLGYDGKIQEFGLIGIEIPQLNNKNHDETRLFIEQLITNKDIFLEFEDSSDFYKKVYLWLVVPEDTINEAEITNKMLNAQLLFKVYSSAEYTINAKYSSCLNKYVETTT